MDKEEIIENINIAQKEMNNVEKKVGHRFKDIRRVVNLLVELALANEQESNSSTMVDLTKKRIIGPNATAYCDAVMNITGGDGTKESGAGGNAKMVGANAEDLISDKAIDDKFVLQWGMELQPNNQLKRDGAKWMRDLMKELGYLSPHEVHKENMRAFYLGRDWEACPEFYKEYTDYNDYVKKTITIKNERENP